MILNELMNIVNQNITFRIYDSNDEKIAEYDGRNDIPAVFNDVEVTYVTMNDDALEVYIHYIDNLKSLDYLKDRLNDIAETIACDEYHYDNPDAVNQAIVNGLANIADDIKTIRYNIDRKLPWDDEMYI